jgi:hypothetical protein
MASVPERMAELTEKHRRANARVSELEAEARGAHQRLNEAREALIAGRRRNGT